MIELIKKISFAFIFWLLFLSVSLTRLLFVILLIKHLKKQSKTPPKVLFLENFPVENAGYQYRAKKWQEIFVENNIPAKVKTLYSKKEVFEKYLRQHVRTYFVTGIIKRYLQIIGSVGYNVIIVRRELLQYNDYGNLFMEKLLFSIHKNVILDFDDNISKTKKEGRAISTYGKTLLERNNKFIRSLNYYGKYTVCSDWHRNLIYNYNPRALVEIIPTCVDYNTHPPKEYNKSPITRFGWIGSVGNQKYLDIIIEPLNRVSKNNEIELHVISGKPYEPVEAKFRIVNKNWGMCSQIEDMLCFDVGLMPLFNNDITIGKCGFKLLQYMGLGIVCIASAIGTNNLIIDDNTDGYLVSCENEWENKFNEVLGSKEIYTQIGRLASKKVATYYTFQVNAKKYMNFLSEQV